MRLCGNASSQLLADHLMKKPENEHIEVHEMRGFAADTLSDALREAQAVSRGTKCRRFLYSLSLSPPEKERVPVSVVEDAIERIEARLGLAGHPGVIVFHKKAGPAPRPLRLVAYQCGDHDGRANVARPKEAGRYLA